MSATVAGHRLIASDLGYDAGTRIPASARSSLPLACRVDRRDFRIKNPDLRSFSFLQVGFMPRRPGLQGMSVIRTAWPIDSRVLDMTLRLKFALIALVALVSGCQSTSLRSAWFDTDFTGPPLRKIVVSASIGSTADSRGFEDSFADKLRAVGVEAVAGVGEGNHSAEGSTRDRGPVERSGHG